MLLPRNMLRIAITVVLASSLALAQTGKPPGGAGTGTTGTGTGTTTTPGTSQPRQPIPPVTDQRRAPQRIFLTGRVLVDDGSPLPERAAIERVCSGRAVREAYTDASGYFNFEVGRDIRIFQDASTDTSDMDGFGGRRSAGAAGGWPGGDTTQTGISEQYLQSCELRASVPGFRSDSLMLAGRQFTDPNVGTIVLHRLGKIEGAMISATTLQAPKAAKRAVERARKAVAKQSLQEAQQQLEEAVRLYPKYAEAWSELGVLHRKANRVAEAQNAFQQALAADPKFIPPYLELALLAARAQQWQRVVELTESALALDAYDYPGVYFYNSVAHFNLHQWERAEKSARSARRLDSQYKIPRIDLLLGRILAERQDYNGAADQLRTFLQHAPNDPEASGARAQLQDIEARLAPRQQ